MPETESASLPDAFYGAAIKARQEGATWQEVGNLVGTTRQVAERRYGGRERVLAAATVSPSENPDPSDDYSRGYYDAINYVRAALPEWALAPGASS